LHLDNLAEMPEISVEICVDSTASALSAAQNGAARVELCSDLLEGGITPSHGLIKHTVETLKRNAKPGATPCLVMVMIRPRGGDFCYTQDEFQAMQYDIEACKLLGVDGVVLGVLMPNGRVDIQRTQKYASHSTPTWLTQRAHT